MNPPSSKEYKVPQLLGDEQSRLIRMEEMATGVKELMSELRDDMKSINRKLATLEQNRAVSEVQASQNAKDIIELQTDLKVACKEIGDIQSELKSYKFTGNIMKGFIGTLMAGVIWLLSTTIETQRIAGNNSLAVQNLKDADVKLENRSDQIEGRINDGQIGESEGKNK